jgi:hypothetical protein
LTTPNGNISTLGGGGGKGGNGGNGAVSQSALSSGSGASGGAGGVGGNGGNFIAGSTATPGNGINPSASWSASGGNSGNGGTGGNGAAGTATASGGNGGNGGASSIGGTGGKGQLTGTFNFGAGVQIVLTGGISGNGGNGGTGGNGTAAGGTGGTLNLPKTAPATDFYNGTAGNFFTSSPANPPAPLGGAGGAASTGGAAGTGGSGGAGGNAGNAGAIGATGSLILSDAYEQEDQDQAPNERASRKRTQIASAKSSSDFRPVAFSQPVLAICDADLSADNVLLNAQEQDISVKCGHAKILVKKGATAYLINDGRKLSILALDDKHIGDISISASGSLLNLKVGERVELESSAAVQYAAQNSARLALRNRSEIRLANGAAATVSEFSIPYAVSQFAVLHNLKNSSDDSARGLYKRLLKNAIILQALGAKRGMYQLEKPIQGENLASSQL